MSRLFCLLHLLWLALAVNQDKKRTTVILVIGGQEYQETIGTPEDLKIDNELVIKHANSRKDLFLEPRTYANVWTDSQGLALVTKLSEGFDRVSGKKEKCLVERSPSITKDFVPGSTCYVSKANAAFDVQFEKKGGGYLNVRVIVDPAAFKGRWSQKTISAEAVNKSRRYKAQFLPSKSVPAVVDGTKVTPSSPSTSPASSGSAPLAKPKKSAASNDVPWYMYVGGGFILVGIAGGLYVYKSSSTKPDDSSSAEKESSTEVA